MSGLSIVGNVDLGFCQLGRNDLSLCGLTESGNSVGRDVPLPCQAVASHQYRDRNHLDDFAPTEHFAAEYSIVPCLMKDGHQVAVTLTSMLTAARATVYAEVTTVTARKALPVTGWMMAWHTADWHRNNVWVELDAEAEGPPLRRRDYWR